MSLPLIIGHRGASALAPENTIAAFRRAIDDGADGIEFDVRLARDGVAVVIHDATLERTGLVRRKVSDLTAAELGATEVGRWFRQAVTAGAEFAGETVPTLQQVFELFSEHNGLLYLEMKPDAGTGNELASEVVRMIRQSTLVERVIVECFDLSLIQRVKQIDSRIRAAALFEPKLLRTNWFFRQKLAALASASGANEIALHHALASRRMIEQAQQQGLSVVVWTVDNPEWVIRGQALGVSALITNNPASLLTRRNSTGV